MRGIAGLGLCALAGGGAACGGWLQAPAEPTATPAPSSPPSPHSREALYYTSMVEESLRCDACHDTGRAASKVLYCHRTDAHSGTQVKCQLCPKGCVISEGHRGDCRVRENRGGKLYTMVYGNPCAVHVDPIEKKPFYHFYPTAAAFSIATAGCNLHCLYCQNWTISQVPPEETENVDLPPEMVVALAKRTWSPVIAYTYAEPTVFYEYMLDTARLGREAGVKSVVVSAGYYNPEPIKRLCEVVDAIKIDLKGFNREFYRKVCFATLEPVLETIKTIHESGIHLEIVNLVVPTLNDDEDELGELARWIVDNVGPDVPVHYSRFFPQYKLTHLPPTPVEKLERARQIALDAGIRYAYVGNVPGHPGDQTYCHHCGEMIIQRQGFAVVAYHIKDGKCGYCGTAIPGVWWRSTEAMNLGQFRGFGGRAEY